MIDMIQDNSLPLLINLFTIRVSTGRFFGWDHMALAQKTGMYRYAVIPMYGWGGMHPLCIRGMDRDFTF